MPNPTDPLSLAVINGLKGSHANPGQTVQFTKAKYEELIKFIQACNDQLHSSFLSAGPGMRLDDLPADLLPGSKDWAPAGAVLSKADAWGKDTFQKLQGMHKELTQMHADLLDAVKVFEKHDDLATMSAKDFLQDYPALGSGAGGFGSGSPAAHSGATVPPA